MPLSWDKDAGTLPDTVTFFFTVYETCAMNWFSLAMVVEKPAVLKAEDRPIP